jgi:hypothetical protein
MSNALALAAVTAVLQHFLNIVYHEPDSPFGGVTLSAVAPDVVQSTMAGGSASQIQVNLFLHQVTPNAAWRNIGLPQLGPDGITQLKNPPLALDLHYLLTAYASKDSEAEALLGFGVLMLHENPILRRDQIRTALGVVPPTNPLSTVLHLSGLADQIEMIKITPATLGREEMAWLWTALKADYRPTFPFQASVVLIDPQISFSFALPVLSRNIAIQPGPPPQLFSVQPQPHGQSAPAQGDSVTLIGASLLGASQIALANPRLGIQYPPFAPDAVTDTSITFKVPVDAINLPAGIYSLWVIFKQGAAVVQSSNVLPFAVAPTVLPTPPTVVVNPLGTLVTIHCAPQVLPNQSVSLALSSTAVSAETFDIQTPTPSFQFPLLASGPYLARLRVDGVDSPVQVNWTPLPPSFAGPTVTI